MTREPTNKRSKNTLLHGVSTICCVTRDRPACLMATRLVPTATQLTCTVSQVVLGLAGSMNH
jgi:hypothetical protein